MCSRTGYHNLVVCVSSSHVDHHHINCHNSSTAWEILILIYMLIHQAHHIGLWLQQKMKEESDAKRQSLDGRHQFIITAIADKLEMNNNEVEDLLLEGNQVYTMYK